MSANGSGGAVSDEKINTDIITLTRHLNEEQTKHAEATGDFTYVRTMAPLCSLDTLADLTRTASSAMLSNSPSSRSHTTSAVRV
jgi:fructose-1,6-bisphosphatase I